MNTNKLISTKKRTETLNSELFLRVLDTKTYSSWANANVHLDEFRTGDAEERHACFTSCCLGEKGFPRTWWTTQDGALCIDKLNKRDCKNANCKPSLAKLNKTEWGLSTRPHMMRRRDSFMSAWLSCVHRWLAATLVHMCAHQEYFIVPDK